MNKNLDIQLLQDTIDDLKNNPNACTTIWGMTSTDGTFTIPESNPGEKLSRFIQYFFENGTEKTRSQLSQKWDEKNPVPNVYCFFTFYMIN